MVTDMGAHWISFAAGMSVGAIVTVMLVVVISHVIADYYESVRRDGSSGSSHSDRDRSG